MRNLTAIFAKFLEICKDFSSNLVNESGNVPRRGVVQKFSGLEVIALSMTAEHFSIDSENLLFHILHKYKSSIPNLISRRQYNDRRKQPPIKDIVHPKAVSIMVINCMLSVA